jgi:hypothetical protein
VIVELASGVKRDPSFRLRLPVCCLLCACGLGGLSLGAETASRFFEFFEGKPSILLRADSALLSTDALGSLVIPPESASHFSLFGVVGFGPLPLTELQGLGENGALRVRLPLDLSEAPTAMTLQTEPGPLVLSLLLMPGEPLPVAAGQARGWLNVSGTVVEWIGPDIGPSKADLELVGALLNEARKESASWRLQRETERIQAEAVEQDRLAQEALPRTVQVYTWPVRSRTQEGRRPWRPALPGGGLHCFSRPLRPWP